MEENSFTRLLDFMESIPAIKTQPAYGVFEEDLWWIKFSINIEHPLAWHTVQELGYVLNYISIAQRLPCLFMPVSPPPYLNGGPQDFLYWVIESKKRDFTPDACVQWLENYLPQPVSDENDWTQD